MGPGDAFLIRWGRWARQDALGPFDTGREAAGLENHVIPWLRERDVAVACWETPGYMPQPEGDISRLALHHFALTILGIQVLDRADFQALAEAAAERNRWEFMVTIAPLPIPNGTGSPVNPIAIFRVDDRKHGEPRWDSPSWHSNQACRVTPPAHRFEESCDLVPRT